MRWERRALGSVIRHTGLVHLAESRPVQLSKAALDELTFQQLLMTEEVAHCGTNRVDLYQYVQTRVIGPEAMTFLEFGVFEGESIRHWTALHNHPSSRFVGFDSFEGLPETWHDQKTAGYFSVNGRIPETNDPRVSWQQGWFDDTVPRFVKDFTPTGRLVLHLDADLYSSTMVALIYLSPWLKPGSVLIFDEFCDRDHEWKAFRDWTAIARKPARLIAEANDMQQAVFVLS